ncbi:maleylpyruvate isomerase family mycothiol-dependent enzyme [Spongiactinospora sp. TRM90649]|uniref:maleylpyruvate isomerase family mycothiol-dependent enzyme n=1 Tax=Spongiactinospora sp. TRM90649 TaxID=3031114 RepID=UPI0023FA0C8E|nr:maleylpyruvate isomerase family mycothiol-dependent enzyme [Spongiactinospora sp. TRM90649]MDF5753147.1 maleylpyruvate isomerase family mycothiol-dependent enzyme [Spongiactinospora sp. TRM90649]
MTRRTLEDALSWSAAGTELFHRAVAGWGEEQYLAPSGLPGWSRKHLVAHVAANADALCNLVRWAATGEKTPMYSSPAQRDADIAAGATRTAAELTTSLHESAERLAVGVAALGPAQWRSEVVTAQGRTVPATEIPWLRSREACVHAVDLAAGVTFADLPAGFLTALAGDIVAKRGATAGLALTLTAAGDRWELPGAGDPVTLTGPLTEVVAYLAGRPHALTTADGSPAPALPAWL